MNYIAQAIGYRDQTIRTIRFEASDMKDAEDKIFALMYWNVYGCDCFRKDELRAWFVSRFISDDRCENLEYNFECFDPDYEYPIEVFFSNIKEIFIAEIESSVVIDTEPFEKGILQEAYDIKEGEKKKERRKQYEKLKEEFGAA